MKKRSIAAGCAAAILSGGLCCLGIFSVRAAEQKKQETAETESESMQTELSEDGSQLKIFDLSLPVPEGMDFQVFDEDGIEIATAVAGDLRIFLSAGETEAVEGWVNCRKKNKRLIRSWSTKPSFLMNPGSKSWEILPIW